MAVYLHGLLVKGDRLWFIWVAQNWSFEIEKMKKTKETGQLFVPSGQLIWQTSSGSVATTCYNIHLHHSKPSIRVRIIIHDGRTNAKCEVCLWRTAVILGRTGWLQSLVVYPPKEKQLKSRLALQQKGDSFLGGKHCLQISSHQKKW